MPINGSSVSMAEDLLLREIRSLTETGRENAINLFRQLVKERPSRDPNAIAIEVACDVFYKNLDNDWNYQVLPS